jgi:FeS assembly protein IscX
MTTATSPTNLITQSDPLTWDDVYAIAQHLHRQYPEIDLKTVSLNMIYQWTVEHPAFIDDPTLCNESILTAIYQEWFEEVNPL